MYDQNFRQETAKDPAQSWTKVEPSIYAQCFTGQAISPENWCVHCHCLDHVTNGCPLWPRKRTWNAAFSQGYPGKLISRFVSSTRSLMATASSARNAVSGTFVAPAVILILQPSARLKVAASPSKTVSHGGANRSCFSPFFL